ncbi:MAG: hypothetical protein JXM70_21885 [Pirellulales bacterium]|nr:hypothetical protein [Pirellulales bacterium]
MMNREMLIEKATTAVPDDTYYNIIDTLEEITFSDMVGIFSKSNYRWNSRDEFRGHP